MSQRISKILKTRLTAARIVFIYFVVGSAWIIFSGYWLSQQGADFESLIIIEALKGLAFVFVTTILLWFLCRSWSQQVAEALSKYEQTRSRFEVYVRNAPIAIALIDKSGYFIEANEATEALTEYKEEELKKISIADLVSADIEDTQAAFQEVFAKGYASRDRTIRCKSGAEKILRVDAVRHTPDQAITFSRDITDRTLSEQKLRRLNAMLRAVRRVNKAIVETPAIDPLIRKICEILVEDREFKHAWIALLDKDGTPLHYHDAPKLKDAQKLKYFLEEGRLPKCIESTKTEDGLILANRPVEQCPEFPIMEGMEECALIGVEFAYDHSFGYIALMADPMALHDQEEIDLFREVVEDLRFALQRIKAETERRRATEDLLVAKQVAEKANRAKDEFLSVMSHELRTPLNPIMGHSSLLMDEINEASQVKSLEQIQQSSERLLSLIDDILFFSQIQGGSKAHSPDSVNLLDCCEKTLEKCHRQYPGRTVHFVNGSGDYGEIPADLLVLCDEEHVRRVIRELVCNACKYTPGEGTVDLRIGQRKLENGGQEVLIEVQDSGIGIEKAALDQLFDPFTQVDSSNTRRYGGVGLGLAICRKIADALGGTLTAESQPGRGSCFRFLWPIETPAAVPGPEEEHGPNKVPPSDSACVLLVEDNPSNALVARTMLKRWGIQTDHSENGRSAVERCAQRKYDLILMDLSMPVMNGFEATREIRNSETENQGTPIVGLTAHVGPEVREDCHAAGMDDFTPKPIRKDAFKECLGKYLRIS